MTNANDRLPDDILLDVDGPIAIIRLNRPHRRNALSYALLTGLRDMLHRVAASDCRVLILRGEGADFCVGADVKQPPRDAKNYDYETLASIYETGRMLHDMKQVTIAAVDGGCAGPGLAWAAACDFRFASDRAVFNTAFLKVGVAGEMGLAWSLLRLIGGAWARELLFFLGKLCAPDALKMGLVTRIFAPDVLHQQTLAAAQTLADYFPPALRAAKSNILSAEKLTLADFVQIEGSRHAHIAFDPARMEGFRASTDKRDPRFER
ncbi:MAG: enoyl-CoA hydratase-related protein [Rhizorhabdus sp.]